MEDGKPKTVKLVGESLEIGRTLAGLHQEHRDALTEIQDQANEEIAQLQVEFMNKTNDVYRDLCEAAGVDPMAQFVLDVSYLDHGDLFLKPNGNPVPTPQSPTEIN